MFYEGMIYSVMDLGGYLFSGFVTSKFDSFKSAQVFASIAALMMATKLCNLHIEGSSQISLIATYIAVTISSCLLSIRTLNQTKVVRSDLAFISVDSTASLGALVSQIAPRFATIGSPKIE